MRIWSLHPKYLDRLGLLACWRETLLAQKVLRGKTKGYRNHPQLLRSASPMTPRVPLHRTWFPSQMKPKRVAMLSIGQKSPPFVLDTKFKSPADRSFTNGPISNLNLLSAIHSGFHNFPELRCLNAIHFLKLWLEVRKSGKR